MIGLIHYDLMHRRCFTGMEAVEEERHPQTTTFKKAVSGVRTSILLCSGISRKLGTREEVSESEAE